MNSLLQLTLDAHGGLERWRRFEHVSAHLRNDGVLWTSKQQEGVIDDVNVRVALHREWASHSPCVEPIWRTSFEPHRVAIETTDGRVIEETHDPTRVIRWPRARYTVGPTAARVLRRIRDVDVPDSAVPLRERWRVDGGTASVE